jgi:hypothetical protein
MDLPRRVVRKGMQEDFHLVKRSDLIDANHQIEGPEKHHQSSGLLASFMVTLFTVWVYIMVVLTSLCPSNS